MAGIGMDVPCKETAPMVKIVGNAKDSSDGAWSFVRRAKLIRENLLGSEPEKTSAVEGNPPACGVIELLVQSGRDTERAFNALAEELAQIEKCLGL